MRRTIQERLTDAEVVITNSLDDAEIAAALAVYNFTTERIQGGKTILDSAREAVNKQRIEYGEQYDATETVNSARNAVDKKYQVTLKIARIALKDNTAAQTAMMLTGRRKETLTGWLEQTKAFYDNLLNNSDWLTAMANYGFTPERLAEERNLVNSVEEARHKQLKEIGEAQDATEKRDDSMETLDAWMAEFRQIAVIALTDNPQWLEKLGIKA